MYLRRNMQNCVEKNWRMAYKSWKIISGREFMIPMDAFVSGSWQRKPDIRNVISGVFFSRCMEFRQRILNAIEKAKARLKANVNFELTMELLLLTIKEN